MSSTRGKGLFWPTVLGGKGSHDAQCILLAVLLLKMNLYPSSRYPGIPGFRLGIPDGPKLKTCMCYIPLFLKAPQLDISGRDIPLRVGLLQAVSACKTLSFIQIPREESQGSSLEHLSLLTASPTDIPSQVFLRFFSISACHQIAKFTINSMTEVPLSDPSALLLPHFSAFPCLSTV